MEISNDFLLKLYQIGGMASANGLSDEAQAIMSGVTAVRPGNVTALIGLAGAKINAGCIEEAIGFLRDHALRIQPENPSIKCMLGVAYTLAGQETFGHPLLQESLINGDDSDKALATAVLDGHFQG